MAKRLRTWFYALCMFISYCGWSFATPHQNAEPELPSVGSWSEPAACLHVQTLPERDCITGLGELGNEALAEAKIDYAIYRFTQLLDLYPVALIHHNRGVAYLRKGDLWKARVDFNAALQMDFTLASSWHGLARVDYLARRYDHALVFVNVAIGLNPARALYVDLRADIYKALGRHRLARRDTRLMLALRKQEDAGTLAVVGTTELK